VGGRNVGKDPGMERIATPPRSYELAPATRGQARAVVATLWLELVLGGAYYEAVGGTVDYLAICAAAFAPAVFWLWYFYSKDKLDPEPKRLIAKTFLLGMLLGVPATFLELLFINSLAVSVVIAPAIEESLKYAGVRFTVYRSAEFDEPLDGIIYAAAIALGFASVENVFYLLATYFSVTDAEPPLEVMSPFGAVASVFAIRALISVPSHVLFSSMWGYALGRGKFLQPAEARALIRMGLLYAILCHGLFNFSASRLPEGALGVLLLVAILWRVLRRRIRETQRETPRRAGRDA
jgi:RsiW-degrading membrane proteinase PrsW (M82 family)